MINIEYKHKTSIVIPPGTKIVKATFNNLTTLPALPEGLKHLDVSNNSQLRELPTLPKSLKHLDIRKSGIDIAGLPELPETLAALHISNFLPAILPPSLTYLVVRNFSGPLPSLPDTLIHLDVGDCQGIILPSKLPSHLRFLNCDFCGLMSLPILPETLEELDCMDNHITNLQRFPEKLKIIRCNNNGIITLPELSDKLEILNCHNNQIVELPPLPSTLKFLHCENNKLTSLPVPLPYGLKDLLIENNPPELPYDCSTSYPSQCANKIKLQQYNEHSGKPPVTQLPSKKEYYSVMPIGKQAKRITDLAITFRSAGLPSYVLADIIDWDRNRTSDLPTTSAFDVQSIVLHVIPINERKESFPLYAKRQKKKYMRTEDTGFEDFPDE